MDLPKYEYDGINEAAREIRLLTLLPADFDAPIQAILGSSPLMNENAPQYEALSYAWGSLEDQIPIYIKTQDSYHVDPSASSKPSPGRFTNSSADVSDKPRRPSDPPLLQTFRPLGEYNESPEFGTLSVTKNLGRALLYLRYADVPRVLWIDAVCINQQDLGERSKQVLRMADIYTLAHRVVVWLGEEDDNSSLALTTMRDLAMKVKVDWDNYDMVPASEDPSDESWASRQNPLPYDMQILLSIGALLNRSWFERLWIWQEIRLAKREASVIVCGRDSILWEEFRTAVYCIHFKGYTIDQPSSTFSHWTRAFGLCKSQMQMPFTYLVEATMHSRCLDPRDRVFALLSLLRKKVDYDITPDYSKTVAQVYQESFAVEVKNSKSLTILQSCELRDLGVDVPSWVPDLSIPRLSKNIQVTPSAWPKSLRKIPVMEEKTLEVQGQTLATIKHVYRILLHADFSLEGIRFELQRLASNFNLEELYVAGGDLLEAFCRSLIANWFSERFHPPHVGYPSQRHIVEDVREFLDHDTISPNKNTLSYMAFAVVTLQGRCLFTTQDGYIGIGPNSVKEGDRVTRLVGCTPHMVLRPRINREAVVVGEAYCHGAMNNESFLDAFPEDMESVLATEPTSAGIFPLFVNRKTGQTELEDPRLGPLPKEWQRKIHNFDHLFTLFVNSETGEELPYNLDPRILPGAVEIGVLKLETILLV